METWNAVRRTTVYIAFVMCSVLHCYGNADACRVAVRISSENLHYRILSPTVDPVRVQRGFEEFAALHRRCPSIKLHDSPKECTELSEAVRQVSDIVPERMASFEKVTGCKLLPARGKSPAQPPSVNQLITRTLREQQDSDGEASYWIANDLLALLLVYPEEVIENVLANPLFRERFISDLGGDAFEDLDDRPSSTHGVLLEKMRVFADLLSRLQRSRQSQADRAKLISEMAKACRCMH